MSVVAIVLFQACAPLAHTQATAREADYVVRHPEGSPTVVRAIHDGHVLLGMDREQVWTVLGDPMRTHMWQGTRPVEVWIYRGAALHQDGLHLHGADLVRLVFIANRVAVIEPI